MEAEKNFYGDLTKTQKNHDDGSTVKNAVCLIRLERAQEKGLAF